MNDTKICVVSLIGKTQLLYTQSKAWKLNSLIQKNYFNSGIFELNKKKIKTRCANDDNEESADDFNNNECNQFGIETYFDSKNRVIYIHLESIYDTNNAMDVLFENSRLEAPKTFYELWENEHIKYLRSILLLFCLSHILIISSPSCEFDIGYIRFFRIVETLRNKMLPSLVDLIKSLNLPISKEWLYAGRPCSPRVLFTFENCPADILAAEINEAKQAKMIEKLQHSLEDQIYNSLRKSYVITNISNNSLFSIPANQEFAYIHRVAAHNSLDTNRFLLSNLFTECSKAKDASLMQQLTRLPSHAQSSLGQSMSSFNYTSSQIVNSESLDAKLFRKFVFEHVHTALNEGFNDNIGRTNVTPVFELPTASCFYKLFDALCDFFLNEPKSAKIKQQYAQIKSHVDTESQFSENRCKKVLPTALSLYQENLPGHYTKSQHQQRLDKAIHFYSMQARGPMYNVYLEQLTNECVNIWTNGRQLCEAISLTEHACIYNLHRLPSSSSEQLNASENEDEESRAASSSREDEENETASHHSRHLKSRKMNQRSYRKRSRQPRDDDSSNNDEQDDMKKSQSEDESSGNSRGAGGRKRNKNKKSSKPSIKKHNSNIVTIAASNCGEFQMERKDPFDLKEANFTFYEEFNKMVVSSKKKLIKYEFQIFKPSAEHCTSAPLISVSNNKPDTQVQTTQPFSYTNLSQDTNIKSIAINKLKENEQLFPSPLNEQQVAAVATNSDENNKILTNAQPISPVRTNLTVLSTEVYLPGMIHSESPTGLLPRFCSWSLVSIGKNAQYSVHNGLNQPGLLTNHNHLIPWDIIVSKTSAISSVDKQLSASRKNANNLKKNNELLSNQLQSLSLATSSNNKAKQTVTVRAYIGMEYECPCGHRFFCSGPDKISKVSANGNVKDDAYKLLYENMPLYTACPCRNSKDAVPFMAQMMRVFVVTPVNYTLNLSESDSKNFYSSSPPPSARRNASPSLSNRLTNQQNTVKISIQLNPRVQPNPSSPIYFPSNQTPINLTENSIWVLRLPYIYMSDSGQPYYRPKDFETLKNSRVLKGMFSAVVLNNENNSN